MPIFEYECRACGRRVDLLQPLGEAPRRKCPECGKLSLSRLLSTPSFHLRGSGWRKPPPKENKGGRTRKVGHTLDAGPPHSHDDDHGHGHGGHTHSHGGHSHTHGPGQKHSHKH
jgi:putative FmdB family regulatory protein